MRLRLGEARSPCSRLGRLATIPNFDKALERELRHVLAREGGAACPEKGISTHRFPALGLQPHEALEALTDRPLIAVYFSSMCPRVARRRRKLTKLPAPAARYRFGKVCGGGLLTGEVWPCGSPQNCRRAPA